MMKKLLKFSIFVFFAFLCGQFPFAAAEAIEWDLFRDVLVEGYVLVDKNSLLEEKDGGIHQKSRKALYQTITEAVPLAGARVRLEGGESSVLTDEDGFFAFTKKLWFFQKKSLAVEVITPLKTFNVELKIGEDENPFLLAVVDRDGKSAVYLRADGPSAVPVAFVSMDMFKLFSSRKEGGTWNGIAGLLETDPLSSNFEFYLIKYSEQIDFRNVPAQIHRRIAALYRIHGESVRCAGFGLGALALRHYSVSKFYESGTIERLLQVAPPNQGIMFPEPLGKALPGNRAQFLSQLDPEGGFIKALNGRAVDAKDDVGGFSLDPGRMNDHGFNPEIRTFIIAGEIIEQSKEALKSTGEAVSRSAGAFVEFWNDFLSGSNMDPGFLKQLKEAGRQLLEYYEQGLENLPAGDLVVPVDRALVEGVEYKILPHGHFSLLAAEDVEDERYRTVRDFLME